MNCKKTEKIYVCIYNVFFYCAQFNRRFGFKIRKKNGEDDEKKAMRSRALKQALIHNKNIFFFIILNNNGVS